MPFLKVLVLSVVTGIGAASAVAADVSLVMVEQPGCIYCERWDDEIGPAYPNTDEGRFAPLLRADLREGAPEGISYARRINFTPTFILVDNGQEVARIEGYPGEDFFWPVLTGLLEEHTDFISSAPAAPVSN